MLILNLLTYWAVKTLSEAKNHFYNLRDTWYVDPEDRNKFIAGLKDQKIVEEFECIVRDKNGTHKWVAVNAIIRENENILDGWVINISERKKAETALKESEERYRNIIERIPMGMHLFDLDEEDRLIFVGTNLSADTILGVENKQNFGKSIEEISPQLKNTLLSKVFKKLAKEGGIWNNEFEYHNDTVNGIFNVYAFQTSQNKMVVCFIDITERRNMEKKLIQSEEKYRNLFEHSPLGIFRTSIEGQLLEGNAQLIKISGCETLQEAKNYFVNLSDSWYVNLKDREEIIKTLNENGYIDAFEYKARNKKGQEIWIISSYKLDKENNIIDGFFYDITSRKKAEESLIQSEEKIQESY